MTSYTNIFNGNVVQPTPISYIEINLNENLVLSWSTQFQDTNLAVSTIIDAVPTTNGFTLTMPDATQTSVGQSVLINNPTTFSFTLLKNDGSTLANIAATTINYFYLIDNTTTGGTWRNVPFGGGYTAVTSVNAVSDNPNITVTGGPITTTGTFTFNLNDDLLALTSFGNNTGLAVRTAVDTWNLATLVGTINQITVTNGSGVAGNPTFSLASNISGVNSIIVGNLSLTANTISSTNLNGNIALAPNGTGQAAISNGNPLAFYDAANTNYISFSAGNITQNFSFIWPTVAPTSGQVLGYTGTNQLGWASVSTFGGPSTVNAIARFSNTGGSLTNSGVLLDNSNNITGSNSIGVGSIGLGQVNANTISTTNANGNLNIECNGSGELTVFNNITLRTGNNLKFYNAGNTAYNFLNGANAIATVGWSLPVTDGIANSMMKTNGAGSLSFSSILDSPATLAQMQNAPITNNTNPVVPTNMVYHRGVAKAWINFNGNTSTVNNSWNVTSIVRNSAGNYTINLSFTAASSSMAVIGSLGTAGFFTVSTATTTTVTVITLSNLSIATDFTNISVVIFGTQ